MAKMLYTTLALKLINIAWPVGQVVKTPPFHGGITGSNPVRVRRGRAEILVCKNKGFFFTHYTKEVVDLNDTR